MCKKLLCTLLSFLLVLSLLPVSVAAAEDSGKMTVEQLQEKFPAGRYWNGGNADSTTDQPCTHHGYCGGYSGACGCNSFQSMSIQCMGYAEKLGYDFTGCNPRFNANGWYTYEYSSAVDSVKPGDIIRFYTSRGSKHSAFVIKVEGETIFYTDCNWDGHCIIRWDGEITKTELKNRFIHMRKAPYEIRWGNVLTLQFHANGGKLAASSVYLVTTGSSTLNMRSGPGLSNGRVTSVPNGAMLTAFATATADGYTWIQTTYNGYTGWCAVSGGLAKLIDQYYLSDSYIFTGETGSAYCQKWIYGSGSDGLVSADELKLSREGYQFLGWSCSADGSSGVFQPGDGSVTAETVCPGGQNSTVTLYAIWKSTAPVLTGISVKTLPGKTQYVTGEVLDITGLTLEAFYDNGSAVTVTEGFAVTGFDSHQTGEQLLTVTYAAMTATFRVAVQEKLQILEQPENKQVLLEENVDFGVVTTGATEYRWQYRKSTTGTWFHTTMTGYDTPEITVPAKGNRNGYQYRCVVGDGEGNEIASEAATLTIRAELTVTKQPRTQSVAQGDNAKFSVSADGAVKYRWQYSRTENGAWYDTGMTGYNTPTLTVSAAESREGYRYRCVLTNAIGEETLSQEAVLQILRVTKAPDGQTAKVGGVAEFTVETNSTGTVQYRWQYRRSANDSWHDTTMTGCNTACLQVAVTAARNGYGYRCVITGDSGSQLATGEAILTVALPAKVVEQPADATANVGDSAVFAVEAENVISWQWQYCRGTSDKWYNTAMTGYATDTLTVAVTSSRQGYRYRCKLTGTDGTVTYTDPATLTIG